MRSIAQSELLEHLVVLLQTQEVESGSPVAVCYPCVRACKVYTCLHECDNSCVPFRVSQHHITFAHRDISETISLVLGHSLACMHAQLPKIVTKGRSRLPETGREILPFDRGILNLGTLLRSPCRSDQRLEHFQSKPASILRARPLDPQGSKKEKKDPRPSRFNASANKAVHL